jgi:hypothetical protein
MAVLAGQRRRAEVAVRRRGGWAGPWPATASQIARRRGVGVGASAAKTPGAEEANSHALPAETDRPVNAAAGGLQRPDAVAPVP